MECTLLSKPQKTGQFRLQIFIAVGVIATTHPHINNNANANSNSYGNQEQQAWLRDSIE